jgi:hypothetical protein
MAVRVAVMATPRAGRFGLCADADGAAITPGRGRIPDASGTFSRPVRDAPLPVAGITEHNVRGGWYWEPPVFNCREFSSDRMAARRRERRMLARVSRAAWRLERAERERSWALASARAEGISIRALAAAAGLSQARVHQITAGADLDEPDAAPGELRAAGWPACTLMTTRRRSNLRPGGDHPERALVMTGVGVGPQSA